MKLKVCGMKYQDNINQVAALQPDYLGFIFYKKSPRFFDGEIPDFPNSIKKVGVFVNEPISFIIEKIETHQLNAVQLHGNESQEYCIELKRHYEKRSDEVISSKESGCHSVLDTESINKNNEMLKQVQHDKSIEIIKVFSIKDKFNFDVLKPYETVCDYYLFDTKGKLPGGNGYAFDWSVLSNYPSTKPYFLSGGIGLDQIESVLSFLRRQESKYCYAIDVNSKFEIKPGLKDIKQLREFKTKMSFRT
ncbi:MAG: phosphoribosylanthranilate isomerase [Flavobacteriaceae bacterium]|nr:phosphoribosylanthranilate isomerase [Flavobacteriaceae bacterium]